MRLVPVYCMMEGVRAWARERLGPDPITKDGVKAVPWGELAWRLPQHLWHSSLFVMRPTDPNDAHIALPVRVVRFSDAVYDEGDEWGLC
jgi:hypothetical protein